jgi:hypothetical protein
MCPINFYDDPVLMRVFQCLFFTLLSAGLLPNHTVVEVENKSLDVSRIGTVASMYRVYPKVSRLNR